ncbi:MAG: hypothetical protein F4139_04625 [Gemmatimonadetes bacterium]|nr:hypothetical protein [Gemmatimonadota bacterium]MYH52221.1 hypothetical protein [Gemmatimonadota bacterium]MYK65500.1 hypothetical protein [Gemmatimonadota bacterium]
MRNGRTAAPASLWLLRLGTLAMVLVLSAHVESAAGLQAAWTTTPDYRIAEPEGTDSGLGRFSRMRIGGKGTRVVVQDSEIVEATPTWRILVFSPEGNLLSTLDAADVPREFSAPLRVQADAGGFWVRHGEGSMRYSYQAREFVLRVTYPPELTDPRSLVPLDDGSFFAKGGFPMWNFEGENAPPREQPFLHIADRGGGWVPDTIAVLDIRNMPWFVGVRGESSRFNTQVSLNQPFADHDLTWTDWQAGSVGIVRRNGPPGVVEVIEIRTTGDTLRHGRFTVPAVPVSKERAESAVEGAMARLRSSAEQHGLDARQLRRLAEDALHIPSHLPAVNAVVPTASGETWLRTPEVADGLAVWYAILRGDTDAAPRRVLLPSIFRLQDAFGDHVWGFAEEQSQPRHILGLRLVPPAG